MDVLLTNYTLIFDLNDGSSDTLSDRLTFLAKLRNMEGDRNGKRYTKVSRPKSGDGNLEPTEILDETGQLTHLH